MNFTFLRPITSPYQKMEPMLKPKPYTGVRLLVCLALLLGGLAFATPTTAQGPVTIPHLTEIASDTSGVISIAYPSKWQQDFLTLEDWVLSPNGIEAGDGATQLVLSVRLNNTAVADFDQMPQWMIDNGWVLDSASFSVESYAGYRGWLAQGRDPVNPAIFLAVLSLEIQQGLVAIVETRFPAAQLSQHAPLVTVLLDNLIILPERILANDERLRVNVPGGWQASQGLDTFVAAPTLDSLQQTLVGDVPQPFGVSIRFIQGNFRLEDLLDSPTAIPETTTRFLSNAAPATIRQQRDNTNDSTALIFVRQRSSDSFIEMRVESPDAALLMENQLLLKAIFTNIRLQ